MCVKREIFTAGGGTGPAGCSVLGLRLGGRGAGKGFIPDLVHQPC